MTRWLTDEEQRAWRQLAAVFMQLPSALESQLQRDSGLTHFAYWVLAMLSEAPNRALRMSELAALAHGSQSRLSHLVSRLEERGWVRRETCPGDRRRTFCTLTDEGLAVLAAAAPGHVNEVRKYLFDRLTREQVRQLMEITNEIRAGLTGEFVDPTEGAPAHV